ncbi:MAG TPA: hypothetical protein VFC06_05160, partial [Demequina sp.]|nr:hypothetical protein [Demequina sp.]
MGELRSVIAGARRIVVKIGSSSLTGSDGHLSIALVTALSDVLAAERKNGRQIVLVTSGAIAAGIGPMGLPARPRDLEMQQAAASVGQGLLVAAYTSAFASHGLTVGQGLLVAAYTSAFARHGLTVGQVLLTTDDM